MNWYDAMEEAYKKGYKKGFEDAKKDDRHGRWIIHSSGKGNYANNWAECSCCHVCGSPNWKVCPVCETKMGGTEFAEKPKDDPKDEIDFDYNAED